MGTLDPTSQALAPPTGVGQRVFALVIDNVLLGVLGYFLAATFEDQFVMLGSWGLSIGLTISLLYFGIFNSRVGKGATLGKRWMRIQVVGIDGEYLPLNRSAARYLILALPSYVAVLPFPDGVLWSSIWSALVFGLLGVITYLFLINTPYRRSLHDLAVGSVVICSGPIMNIEGPNIRQIHYYIAIGIFVMLGAIPIISSKIHPIPENKTATDVFLLLEEQLDTEITQVVVGTAAKNVGSGMPTSEEVLRIVVWLHDGQDHWQRSINEVASIVFANPLLLTDISKVIVEVQWGYNIGISQSTYSYEKSFASDHWK